MLWGLEPDPPWLMKFYHDPLGFSILIYSPGWFDHSTNSMFSQGTGQQLPGKFLSTHCPMSSAAILSSWKNLNCFQTFSFLKYQKQYKTFTLLGKLGFLKSIHFPSAGLPSLSQDKKAQPRNQIHPRQSGLWEQL